MGDGKVETECWAFISIEANQGKEGSSSIDAEREGLTAIAACLYAIIHVFLVESAAVHSAQTFATSKVLAERSGAEIHI